MTYAKNSVNSSERKKVLISVKKLTQMGYHYLGEPFDPINNCPMTEKYVSEYYTLFLVDGRLVKTEEEIETERQEFMRHYYDDDDADDDEYLDTLEKWWEDCIELKNWGGKWYVKDGVCLDKKESALVDAKVNSLVKSLTFGGDKFGSLCLVPCLSD